MAVANPHRGGRFPTGVGKLPPPWTKTAPRWRNSATAVEEFRYRRRELLYHGEGVLLSGEGVSRLVEKCGEEVPHDPPFRHQHYLTTNTVTFGPLFATGALANPCMG